MSLTNTAQSYGSLAKTLHWLTALLILGTAILGMVANRMAHDMAALDSVQLSRLALLFSLHKTLGVAAFFVALVRIGWALIQPHPGLPNGEKRLEAALAATVHWALYGAMLVVPLSGWVHHAAAPGFAPIWWPFGQTLPLIPASEALSHAAADVHWLATKVLIGAIVLHVGGALKHALIDRDGTLSRMLPGRRGAQPSPRQPGPLVPIAAAVTIWVAVIGAGLAIAPAAAPLPAASASAADSEWRVQEGRLGLTIVQFNSAVSGGFDSWQAAISYDPATGTGRTGVEIDIASLRLGSVREQAMGADFFDQAAHPVAVFAAEITRDEAGAHLATGTLSLRGKEVPVTLPFDLTVTDNTAEMVGELELDRRDFGIGVAVTDPAQLGFSVTVTVTLTATRDQ